LLDLNSGARLAPRLVRHALRQTGAVARGGNLFCPAFTDQKPIGKFSKRSLALIVGEKQLTAQIISKGFPHICVRRRVSPKQVYTI
jgi:hypothetical protein